MILSLSVNLRFHWIIPFLIACFTSFFLLGSKSFWFDEAFSVWLVQNPHPLPLLWNHEVNMWLYYDLVWTISHIGVDEITIRSFSALFAIGAIPIFYAVAKQLFSKKTAFIASTLLSIHMAFVYYAQEARGYSMMLFFLYLASCFYIRFLKERKELFLYSFSAISVLAIYSHIYAGFVFLAHLAFLFFRSKLGAIKSAGIALLLLMPLLMAPGLHSNVAAWIPHMSITSIIGTFFVLSGDFPLSVPLYAILLGYIIWNKKDWRHQYLGLWIILPLIVVSLFSLFKPIYQSVYFFAILPPFLILTSEAIVRLKRKGTIIFGLLILFSIIRLFFWYSNSSHSWIFSNKKEDWRGASRYVESHMGKNDIVIFYGYYGEEPYEVYGGSQIKNISSGFYEPGGGALLPEPNKKILSQLHALHVWLVLNRNTGNEFNREKQWKEIEHALPYHLIHTEKFYKITVEEFK